MALLNTTMACVPDGFSFPRCLTVLCRHSRDIFTDGQGRYDLPELGG